MPYLAANAVPVSTGWTAAATFVWPYISREGATKINVFVNGTDVVLQVLEENTGFQDDQTQETLLREGFHSREFPTPVKKFRFRVWPNTQLASSGTVDVVALA